MTSQQYEDMCKFGDPTAAFCNECKGTKLTQHIDEKLVDAKR
jgi:hypothetical protein